MLCLDVKFMELLAVHSHRHISLFLNTNHGIVQIFKIAKLVKLDKVLELRKFWKYSSWTNL